MIVRPLSTVEWITLATMLVYPTVDSGLTITYNLLC